MATTNPCVTCGTRLPGSVSNLKRAAGRARLFSNLIESAVLKAQASDLLARSS